MQPRILVPLDGSPVAEKALQHALALARVNAAVITLLRVVNQVHAAPTAWPTSQDHLTWRYGEQELKDARDYVNDVARRLEGQGFNVRAEVLEGDPASEIVDYGEKHPDVAFIAMSTHGRSGIQRLLFGSVAEKVLHAACVPLLLIKPTHDTEPPKSLVEYSRILLPLDGSAFAEQAIEHAEKLVHATGAILTIISAPPRPDYPPAFAESVTIAVEPELWQEQVAWITKYIEETANRLRARGITVETHVIEEQAAEAILSQAHLSKSDLIVMATHGRTGLSRLWLGSVALKVVKGAEAPVLLIRAKQRVKMAADVKNEEHNEVRGRSYHMALGSI